MPQNKENAIKARREYHKRWRSQHKDKVREYNRRYWERVAERKSIKHQKGYDDSN